MKKYIPCIVMLIIVTLCVSLGIWQLYRLDSKQKLINNITQKEKMLPINLDDALDLNSEDLIYTQFKVTGSFLPSKHILLYGRYKDKYVVVSPLLTSSGKILMVAQGIISHKQAPIFLQNISNNKLLQNVEVIGTAIAFESPNRFTPDNNLQSNIWFCLNHEDIKNYLNHEYDHNLLNFYILKKSITPTNPELGALQTNLLTKIQNNHLEYAITWIGLAVIAILIYRYRFYSC